MAATYWVLISDELIAETPDWGSVGLDVIERAREPKPSPGMGWWMVWDEFAPAELEMECVDLEFGLRDGKPYIRKRTRRAHGH